MCAFKIGIMAESLKLPMEQALARAKAMGVDGVQLTVSHGQLEYSTMTEEKIQQVKGWLAQNGLQVSALNGDFGGHGFTLAEENPARIEKSKKVVDLAVALGAPVVTTHAGVIPQDENHPRYAVLKSAFQELGRYAKEKGIVFAIETGPEKATTLKCFLDSLETEGVGVNMDPANLVMVTGDDPAQAVRTLGSYIVHTHAKDGKMFQQTAPQKIYDFFAVGGIEDMRLEEYFLETPLGEGGVDFDAYIQALQDIGFAGYLTVEREVGPDPVGDIEKAVDFLKKLG